MESLVSLFIKKIKIKLEWCQKEHHLEQLKRSQRQVRYVQKCIMFLSKRHTYIILRNTCFFLTKSAMQNSVPLHVRLNNVQVPCYCCVTRYETCADCSLLEAKFICRNPLHLAKVRTGSFAVPVFLTFLNGIDFGRGGYNQTFAKGITRPLHAPASIFNCRNYKNILPNIYNYFWSSSVIFCKRKSLFLTLQQRLRRHVFKNLVT